MSCRTANCRLPSGPLLVLVRMLPHEAHTLAHGYSLCLRLDDTPAGTLVLVVEANERPRTQLLADTKTLAAALEDGRLVIDAGARVSETGGEPA